MQKSIYKKQETKSMCNSQLLLKGDRFGQLRGQRSKVRLTLSPALTLTSWVCCCDAATLAVMAYVPGESSI